MTKGRCSGVAIAFVALGLILMACSTGLPTGNTRDNAGAEKAVLRVGISPDAPPLIYKQNGRIEGLEAEFARQLAAYLGRSLQFVELKWHQQIPALLKNQTDIIMSGMTITRTRLEQVAFSEPYFQSGQMALIRIENAHRYQLGTMSIQKSNSIGVIKETTGQYYAEKRFPNVRQIVYLSPAEAVADLLNNRVEVFIDDAPIILNLAAQYQPEGLMAVNAMLTQEYLGWGMRKEDHTLIDSANRFVQMLMAENRLYPMVKRWIPLARIGNE